MSELKKEYQRADGILFSFPCYYDRVRYGIQLGQVEAL